MCNLSRKKKKTKRRARDDSSSSSDSSSEYSADESSDDTSEEEAEMSNWDLLMNLWPLDSRPDCLKKKKRVNALPIEKINHLFSMFMKSQEKEEKGAQSNCLPQDGKIKATTFKKKKDDCFKRLHPARFQRLPLAPNSDWFHLTPQKLSPIVRNMPLKNSGSHNSISDDTIVKFHDRTRCFQLKHFYSGNYSVRTKPRKECSKQTDNGMERITDLDWEELDSLASTQEAVINWASLLQRMYPYDDSAISFQRLMHRYKWISNSEDFTVRRQCIANLFNLASKENATRASHHQAPLSYLELEELLKEVLLKSQVDPNVPWSIPRGSQKAQNKSKFKSGSANASGNTSGSHSGASSSNGKRMVAQFQGLPVCGKYNRFQKCNNPSFNNGCKFNNIAYAHCCNVFNKEKMEFCLKPHSRLNHVF